MTQLSKTQIEVLDFAKKQIDKARNNDFETWCGRNYKYLDEYEGYREKLENTYENALNGIVSVNCNSRTIRKLEKDGYIEIIYDSANAKGLGFDFIKVLNY